MRKLLVEYLKKERLESHMRRVAKDLLVHQWNIRNEPQRGDVIRVEYPEERDRWMRQGPCPDCPCEAFCDKICGLRAKWWEDFRQGVLKNV